MFKFLNTSLSIRKFYGYSSLKSWFCSKENFENSLNVIQQKCDQYGEVIWQTRTKNVYKVTLPEELGGGVFAYKNTKVRKVFRYLLVSSSGFREMINFKKFQQLGLPVVEILAGGEIREKALLKNTWLVTKFAQNYQSGLTLLDKPWELKKEFLQINLPLIAKVHKDGCHHRGLHPGNLLYSKEENKPMTCLWLDFGSCNYYPLPLWMLKKCFIADVKMLFNTMKLTKEERLEVIGFYLENMPVFSISKEQFVDKTLA